MYAAKEVAAKTAFKVVATAALKKVVYEVASELCSIAVNAVVQQISALVTSQIFRYLKDFILNWIRKGSSYARFMGELTKAMADYCRHSGKSDKESKEDILEKLRQSEADENARLHSASLSICSRLSGGLCKQLGVSATATKYSSLQLNV
jgi:hypothetical protein